MKRSIPIFLFLFYNVAYSQYSLEDYISLAQSRSLKARVAQAMYRLAKDNFLSFSKTTSPSLVLFGNAPVYNRDNLEVRQPDGSVRYIPRSQNSSNVGLSFSKPIAVTGTTISANTSLTRFDDFKEKTRQYNGTPIFFQVNQSLMGYNQYRWDRRIEPLKLQHADVQLQFDLKNIAYEVAMLYFDVVEVQIEEQLAAANLMHQRTNLQNERRKVSLGVSTEDKVLELEMQSLASEQRIQLARMKIRQSWYRLQNYVATTDTIVQVLQVPSNIPDAHFSVDVIFAALQTHDPIFLSYELKKLDMQSKMEQAMKADRRIDVLLSYGLNGANSDIPAIYWNSKSQQRFTVGFNVPLLDWGRRKANLQVMRSQDKVEMELFNTEAEKIKTDITNMIMQFSIIKADVPTSLAIDSLAGKRYAIANQLYQAGKLSLLELQVSQTQKDEARQQYIKLLRQFWEGYYYLAIYSK